MPPNTQLLTVLDLVPFGQTGPDRRFFALRLSHPGWEDWQPGQFIMIRPESFGLDITWGRPLSICHVTRRHLICFFQVRGPGTDRMGSLKAGDQVWVWGPLGNHFALDWKKPTLLLAGGMGIVPFVGYVNRHPRPWNVNMLFGHREPLGCYPVDSINEHIPVDSLQEPENGDLDNFIYTMQEKMRDCAEQDGLALACGPEPFLRCVQDFALQFGLRCQISLERRMACGVGACLGCVTRTNENWPVRGKAGAPVQTCVNGPVFWADQVKI